MKTLLMVLFVVGSAVTALGQSAILQQAVAEVARENSPSGAHARAVLANPIQPGESRAAWDDRLARAVAMEAKTWTPEMETAYTARVTARVQAEAEARRTAELREVRDAIDRQTDAINRARRDRR